MSPTRRDFVQIASAAAFAPTLVRGSAWRILPGFDRYPHAGDPALKELAAVALDAAKRAGASYADLRLTLTRSEEYAVIESRYPSCHDDGEHGAIGVRALADGAWGFAASPVWSKEEAARLGREAAVQAKTNAQGGSPAIELGPPPPAANGVWQTPIIRDPFTVSLAEKTEVAWAFNEIPVRFDRDAHVTAASLLKFWRQEKTFASTEGAFVTQTLHRSLCRYNIWAGLYTASHRASNLLQPQAGGWEAFAQAKLADEIPRLIEEAMLMQDAELVTPDRYDIVFDGIAMARLLGSTIAAAAELDRVLGYEANAGGTSYLAPPETTLGKMTLGPSLLNVTCNRSRPAGAATVQWDDEGVVPDAYTLIKDGVPVDYHTSRALVSTLGSWYQHTGRPARSHGCATVQDATGIPLVQPPNIEMIPDITQISFDDLVAGLDKGLVMCGGYASSDRQQLNGEMEGELVYEVRKGKRVRCLRRTEALFRAPEFWKNLAAIGGSGSQLMSGMAVTKGQPKQEQLFGVAAVPALVKRVAVTDKERKA